MGELIASGKLPQIYRKWRLWTPAQAALAQPPRKEAEFSGMGFDAAGQPLATANLPAIEEVDLNITGVSAEMDVQSISFGTPRARFAYLPRINIVGWGRSSS